MQQPTTMEIIKQLEQMKRDIGDREIVEGRCPACRFGRRGNREGEFTPPDNIVLMCETCTEIYPNSPDEAWREYDEAKATAAAYRADEVYKDKTDARYKIRRQRMEKLRETHTEEEEHSQIILAHEKMRVEMLMMRNGTLDMDPRLPLTMGWGWGTNKAFDRYWTTQTNRYNKENDQFIEYDDDALYAREIFYEAGRRMSRSLGHDEAKQYAEEMLNKDADKLAIKIVGARLQTERDARELEYANRRKAQKLARENQAKTQDDKIAPHK